MTPIAPMSGEIRTRQAFPSPAPFFFPPLLPRRAGHDPATRFVVWTPLGSYKEAALPITEAPSDPRLLLPNVRCLVYAANC